VHSPVEHHSKNRIPVFKGAFIDAIGGELRSTPVHWATRQGHLAMVVLLIQHGADPNIFDGEGACLKSFTSAPTGVKIFVIFFGIYFTQRPPRTAQIKLQNNSIVLFEAMKSSYPGGIRTHDLMFLRRTRSY
jgi:hypothetical protein